MSELELILNLARDVEALLKKAGILGALETHPVIQEIEKLLNPEPEPKPVDNSGDTTNTVPVTNA